MHVVDAIATDGSSVVAEVILNSWVPHLKFRKEERRSQINKLKSHFKKLMKSKVNPKQAGGKKGLRLEKISVK